MGKKAAYVTVNGTYDPIDDSQFILVEANGVPQLTLISEPLKTYDDNFDGIFFCKKATNTKQTTVLPGSFGGSSVSKIGYSRSAGF